MRAAPQVCRHHKVYNLGKVCLCGFPTTDIIPGIYNHTFVYHEKLQISVLQLLDRSCVLAVPLCSLVIIQVETVKQITKHTPR